MPLEPVSTYKVVLKYQKKQFNLVQVLLKLEYPKGGKAYMDIPLYRMKPLQIVQPALQNDILKLQADFVHEYQAGAAVFYVLLTYEHGKRFDVIVDDRAQWYEHWLWQNYEFEASFTLDLDQMALSNKFLYV
jgi:hypothetical protein